MSFIKAMSIPAIGLVAGLGLFASTPLASASATAAPSTANAVGVVITTNSVVATARVAYNGNPGSVFIVWGDGTTSPGATGTPNGSELVLSHTYSAGNGAAFTATVTVSSGADSVTRNVAVTPRYSVSRSVVLFTPLNHCDSSFESETEWHVEQHIRQGVDYPTAPEIISAFRKWDFDLTTNGIPMPPLAFHPLAGSEFTFEMTMADPTIWVWDDITEVDPLFDDWFIEGAVQVHPSLGSYDGSRIYPNWYDDCSVELDSDVTVTLLTPPPPPPPVNVPHIPPPAPPTTNPPPPPCQGNPRNCHPA